MRIALCLLAAAPLWGQGPLSLRDAVRLALAQNPAIAAASEAEQAALLRVDQARSGKLPKVNYSESWARSDNPVFVFSSLLTQHRFSEQNFAIGTLNRPGPMNNFQSQLSADQVLYDGGQTRLATKSATLGRQLTAEERRKAEMELIAGVVRAYTGVVLAGESLKTAEAAVKSAQADLERASSVRSAGMSTDVDVLSIRVHLAGVTEQRIRRAAELTVARAALNQALGQPLDTPLELAATLTQAAISEKELVVRERDASTERPESRQSRLAVDLAQTGVEVARAGMLPQVGIHGAFEADREQFIRHGGVNWLASVSLRWNIFNGRADITRIAEAGRAVKAAEAQAKYADSAVRLEVRRAWADLSAATQRIEVAQAAVAQAEESLRITQNRYEAGMNGVTDLLRTETAVLESRTRYLAAVHDQRVAATMLEFAGGRLTAESEVLN
jgi:outer membrane protein